MNIKTADDYARDLIEAATRLQLALANEEEIADIIVEILERVDQIKNN